MRFSRSWFGLFGSLLLLNLRAASFAAAQDSPPNGQIPAEALGPLLRAAADSSGTMLAPWQRDFMRALGTSGAVSTAALAANADDGSWLPLPNPPNGPGRFYHNAVYDPVDDRMIVFGGWDGAFHNDVWQLSLSGPPTWTLLAPLGTPPSARYGASAILDPIRRRLIVFGGYDGTPRNDTWALSLTGTPTWTPLSTAGTLPLVRLGHGAIYDPVRDRMVVFGGSYQSFYGDTWSLSLSGTPTWAQLLSTGPTRSFVSLIYDPVRDRMIVFGGLNGTTYFNDTWTLSLSGGGGWSVLATSIAPSVRLAHTAIYDPVRDRMIVFGGYGGSFLKDAWTLSLSGSATWSQILDGAGPAARDLHSAIYDPARDRMLVFGGNDGLHYLNELWSLNLGQGAPTWSSMSSQFPTPRALPTAIYDPVRNRMLMFGGYDGNTGVNEVWALALDASLVWTLLQPTGTPPAARRGHSAVYDPVRDRMVIFGGRDNTASLHNDVWALSLSGTPSWAPIIAGGDPPGARWLHAAVYDPVRDRMVTYGGNFGDRDTWALTLGASPTWSRLVTQDVSLVPPRYLHTMIYDPPRDRVLMFGGYDMLNYQNDTWALSLGATPTWNLLPIAGILPPARLAHTAVYDSQGDRMVVFGGGAGDVFFNDTWTLSLDALPTWAKLLPPGALPAPREEHVAVYDPTGNRMVIFGGESGPLYGDAFLLQLGAAPPPPPPPTADVRFDFAPNTLNLTSHGLWVSATLEPKAPLTADQIDVSSIRLNGSVAVDPAAPVSLEDHDGDGIVDLKVKFDRASVEQTVVQGDHVPMEVTGTVNDIPFDETTYIRVKRAVVTAPAANSHLEGGTVTQIHWESALFDSAQAAADTLGAAADSIVSVALLYSADDGTTWDLIANGQPNTGTYDWMVPDVTVDQAKVAVVLVHAADSTGTEVQGFLGTSESFSIQNLVGVRTPAPNRMLLWATPNPSLDGRLRLQFALREGAPARLDLLDLGGRVLASEPVGRFGPGVHSLELSRGGALHAGVYFLRLTQGADEVRARVAVLR